MTTRPRYPEWVTGFTDAVLADRLGVSTLVKGRQYAGEGRVHGISLGDHGDLVTASVRGSRPRPYQVLLRRKGSSNPELTSLATQCSCQLRMGCKHVVALLLQLRGVAVHEQLAPWQRVLAGVTADVERLSLEVGVPLALQFVAGASGVDLRPMVRGKSGKWVVTGINWDAVTSPNPGTYVELQRQALAAIRSVSRRESPYQYYYQRPDRLSLAELPHAVWELLRQARRVGVQFLTSDLPPVRFVESPIEVAIAVRRGRGAELLLEGQVLADGVPLPVARSSFVGRPPHGLVIVGGEETLIGGLVAPLNPAEQALVIDHPRTAIPSQDVAAFLSGYLPALRRLASLRPDEDVELPEPGAPLLTLDVTFPGDRSAALSWGFRYRLGEQEARVGLARRSDEAALRDAEAERLLVEKLPDGPWPIDIGSSGPRPRESAVLTGRPAIEFVTDWLPRLLARDDLAVTVHGEVPVFRQSAEEPRISVAVSDPEAGVTDWFNLAVTVTIDGENVPFQELFTALALGEDHLVLDSGTWFTLDRPELAQLRQLINEARQLTDREPGSLRLRPEHAGLWQELVSLGIVAEQSAAWAKTVGALLNLEELPAAPVPAGLSATLRPYQETGFRWLSFLWDARLGGILADDMGLGKTLQALALVAAASERGELNAPVLVVAPTSVIGTWAAEAGRFAPGLRVVTVPETSRKRRTPLSEAIAGADLVVTSYALVRLDDDEYAASPWSAVVLDEAQFVKNRQSRVYQAVRRLRSRVKFAVTGTPLENNLMDLWSLLSITAPGLFADPNVFNDLYRRPVESGSEPEALARLHRRIRPLMLRRTKESVAGDLPPKQEQVVPVPLSPAHRKLYDKHLQAERRKVLGLVEDLNRNRITILRSLTLLRQLSLSPALIDPGYPAHAGKLDALVELLAEVVAEGHRALVFSQFTTFLRMARDRLHAEKMQTVYLDGRTRDRAARIEEFRGGTAPVFLISLKAGGFGLTLVEADYVFILDPWWNPATEAQAIDRTHRIGQDKPVNVYRLVAEDTIEEKVVALQERKRDLFARVVGEDADLAAPLTADDIRGLLEA